MPDGDRGAAGQVGAALASIDALERAYAGPLFVFAIRRLGDRGAAEEVVQDTLLHAWRSAARFDAERGSTTAWLFTIARNLVTDRLRRDAVRPPRAATDAEDLLDREGFLEEDAIDRAIESWQLADALARLTHEHREAIVLVHYLGLTVREAAARLEVPPGTVKSRVYYGLRALRLQLEEQGAVR